MRNFVDEVVKCKPNMVYIKLTQQDLSQIDDFVRAVIERKAAEAHHLIDHGQEYKRFFTGMMGERAMEILFGTSFIDWSIGYSNDYNTADLRLLGYNVGIKTVELNKFPIIHKVAHRPELINIKRTEDTIILCGLATIDVLNNYQDDDLILSPALRRRGTKTGFYGFEHLLKIETLSDIDKVLNGSRKAQRKYWF